MATKTIKSYRARVRKAGRKANKAQERLFGEAKLGRSHERPIVGRLVAAQDRAFSDLEAARDDDARLRKKKPKGMSQDEWRRQIREGTAMVQNPNESKYKDYSKVAKGGRQPTEFIITTMREPKLLKRAAKVRAKQRRRK